MITAARRAEIEKIVRGMHHEIIQSAKLRYQCGLPPYPQLFSPDAAIEKYGYSFEIRESMPGAHHGQQFQTAGMIDTEQGIVMVSRDLKYEAQRFTAAHELGHLVLHEKLRGMRLHRDRPVTGEGMGRREPLEEEADYFADMVGAGPYSSPLLSGAVRQNTACAERRYRVSRRGVQGRS